MCMEVTGPEQAGARHVGRCLFHEPTVHELWLAQRLEHAVGPPALPPPEDVLLRAWQEGSPPSLLPEPFGCKPMVAAAMGPPQGQTADSFQEAPKLTAG